MPGNAKKPCECCNGSGYYEKKLEKPGPPVMVRCVCKRPVDVLRNAERGWPGLAQAVPIPRSPLYAYRDKNLWVTSGLRIFRNHLRSVVIRSDPNWFFQVVNDASLMDAWLSRIPKEDVYDADVHVVRMETYSDSPLSKAVEPPDLLVIQLGVKVARNEAMPEVFLEALLRRQALSKPTWVFDQPGIPFQSGHRSFSPQALEFLDGWKHLHLTEQGLVGFEAVRTAFPPGITDLYAPPTHETVVEETAEIPKALPDKDGFIQQEVNLGEDDPAESRPKKTRRSKKA